MKSFDLQTLQRKAIRNLKPYSSARDEFQGNASIFLDANENSFCQSEQNYHRYPDPLQRKLKSMLAKQKGIAENQIFIGNGSDEAIDLLFRAFAEPNQDNLLIFPPTYGMYEVSAMIHSLEIRRELLTPAFELPENPLQQVDEHTKLILICSPNNPTGNRFSENNIRKILTEFSGIVVLDEAYIDFSESDSMLKYLAEFPNLVILQTFSKAWGLAGVRVGMAYANPEIISILNKIKPPYNVSQPAQEIAINALRNADETLKWIQAIRQQREFVYQELCQIPFCKVWKSEANFLLVRLPDANDWYQRFLKAGVVVRNRSSLPLCENTLRITIGTEQENNILLSVLQA